MASRRPSPTKLMLMVAKLSATAGNTHRHQKSPITVLDWEPVSILPHVGLGSTTPKPRKESEDSVSRQVAKPY